MPDDRDTIGDDEIDRVLSSMPRSDGACTVTREQLLAWQRGELDEAAAREVEGTLARSPSGRDIAMAEVHLDPALEGWAVDRLKSPHSRRRRAWILAAGFAAAASLPLVMHRNVGDGAPGPYRISLVAGGVKRTRGGSDVATLLRPDSDLTIVVVPASDSAAPGTTAALFELTRDLDLRRLPARVRIRDGAARLTARASHLFRDEEGPHQLMVGIARDRQHLVNAAGASPESVADVAWVGLEVVYRVTLGDESGDELR